MAAAFKPTLSLDFDGCIHSYERGWQGGQIYGRLVPGFCDWALKAQDRFSLVVHTSRAVTPIGTSEVAAWLTGQLLANGMQGILKLEVSATKPPALLSIDDRCVRFDGDWSAAGLQPDTLAAFKPWMDR